MRAIQFAVFGEPEDVLRLEEAQPPSPGAGEIRVKVHAVGLNPADWAVVGGLFAEHLPPLPRGIGLEVSGVVDEVGPEVGDVAVGDLVFGPVAYGHPTAGAADLAVLSHWVRIPRGLDLVEAATLPMAVETAWRALDDLEVTGGETLLVHGAGSVVGEAVVALALGRGTKVIATAGPNRTAALTELGAEVTAYGEGMADRVRAFDVKIDRALDASPVSGSLPALIEIVGDADRVLTISHFAEAEELGTRSSIGLDENLRYDVLPEVAQLAAEGKFELPIAQTFSLDEFPEAVALSRSGHPGGKVMLLA